MEQLPRPAEQRPAGADEDALVWAVWAGASLSVVIALTLLVSGRFGQRALLLVFAGPVLAFLVLGAVRRWGPQDGVDPGAGGPPQGDD
jgi:hypothetical protein